MCPILQAMNMLFLSVSTKESEKSIANCLRSLASIKERAEDMISSHDDRMTEGMSKYISFNKKKSKTG